MRRILLALTATAIVVAGSYAVRIDSPPGRAGSQAEPEMVTEPIALTPPITPPAVGTVSTALADADVPAELNRLIQVFERRTKSVVDPLDFRTLGSQYSTRARLTGDIADYMAAAAAYQTAHELAPSNRAGRLGYATAAAAVHDFVVALDVAAEVLTADEADPDALVVAADAAIELGRLEDGVDYLDRLEATAPGHPAVLARLANYNHLTGDQDQAIALATAAQEAATDFGFVSRNLAFYPLLRADLLLDAGRYQEAQAAVDEAIEIDPGYPAAHAGLGRVLAHRGEFAAALAAYQQAVSLQSDPGWDIAIGELLTALGLEGDARPYFDRAIEQLTAVDERIGGRVLAGLYADLDIEPAEALRIAKEDLKRRRDIHAYDTLAWALYRSGMYAQAQAASAIATSTGAMDAGLLYHSALIDHASGDTESAADKLATLLATNPGFNPVQAAEAAELLAGLRR